MSDLKILAVHPDLGQKEFTRKHWENITGWPDQGGWVLVKKSRPEPPAPAEVDLPQASPVSGKRKSKKG